MKQLLACTVCVLILILSSSPASAWWDTQIQVTKMVPTVKDVQAEEALFSGTVTKDPLAWGGKAALLKPGGASLSFDYQCSLSHYLVTVICRGTKEATRKEVMAEPVFLGMRVTDLSDKSTRVWRQRITYMSNRYEDGGHLYFPI